MNDNNGLPLVAPRVIPVLEPAFRPAVLANRAFRAQARATRNAVTVRLGLEQTDGTVSHFTTPIRRPTRGRRPPLPPPANPPPASGWGRAAVSFFTWGGPPRGPRSWRRI